MYKGKRVSLILPAFNEQEAITDVILDFWNIGIIDEIIVVDNNSTDSTAKLVKGTKKAKLVKEYKQGYGYAIRKGLGTATGDILVLCDADKTYAASDIKKLLAQSTEYDFVFSTRMDKKYNFKGARMGFLRRSTNIAISKLIQLFFHGPELTDLGATFRLLNRKPYETIRPYFRVGGSHFQPELTILALLNGFTIREVPVHYGPRTGKSKISGSILGGIKTAKAMLGIILYYRLKTLSFNNTQE